MVLIRFQPVRVDGLWEPTLVAPATPAHELSSGCQSLFVYSCSCGFPPKQVQPPAERPRFEGSLLTDNLVSHTHIPRTLPSRASRFFVPWFFCILCSGILGISIRKPLSLEEGAVAHFFSLAQL